MDKVTESINTKESKVRSTDRRNPSIPLLQSYKSYGKNEMNGDLLAVRVNETKNPTQNLHRDEKSARINKM